MHVLKDPKENMASENSPGGTDAKIYIFRSRGIFWETRFTFLRHIWKVNLRGLDYGETRMEILRDSKDIEARIGLW